MFTPVLELFPFTLASPETVLFLAPFRSPFIAFEMADSGVDVVPLFVPVLGNSWDCCDCCPKTLPVAVSFVAVVVPFDAAVAFPIVVGW